MRQLLGAVSQYDKSQIVLKLRAARTRIRAKEGVCEGRKPFGFREGEQRVLERMKALRMANLPYDKIAATLNLEGLEPRTAARWYAGVVRRVLVAQ